MSATSLMQSTTSTSTSPLLSVTSRSSFPGIQNYIGPGLLSALVQAIEMGVIINQAITFIGHTMVYKHHSSENPDVGIRSRRSLQLSGPTVRIGERGIVKCLAIFALVISIFETAASFQASWNSVVVNFGNWPQAVSVQWQAKIQSIIVVALAAPVQSFLIWRCWLLTHKNIYVLTSLTSLLLASIALATVSTVRVFHHNFSVDKGTQASESSPSSAPRVIDFIFVSTLAIPALLDVCLTSILLNFLLRSRTSIVSNRFRKTLQTVIIIVWEAALPPCICALLTLITYFTLADFSSWDLLFQALLGQLYVISLFGTLNGFNDVKNRYRDVDPTTALGYNVNADDRIMRRSRITSSNEFTMTIEIQSSEGRSTVSKRPASFVQVARTPQSPRLQVSFPPSFSTNDTERKRKINEEPSPLISSRAANAELDLEDIVNPNSLGKDLDEEKSCSRIGEERCAV